MIQQTAITRAIKAHLATMALPPVVWENTDPGLPEPPFVVVEDIRSEPQNVGWCGDLRRYVGRVQVAVVVASGDGLVYAETLAEQISDHFDSAEITADGVTFSIDQQPYISGGYQDGVQYRLPVQIRYSFLA